MIQAKKIFGKIALIVNFSKMVHFRAKSYFVRLPYFSYIMGVIDEAFCPKMYHCGDIAKA